MHVTLSKEFTAAAAVVVVVVVVVIVVVPCDSLGRECDLRFTNTRVLARSIKYHPCNQGQSF